MRKKTNYSGSGGGGRHQNRGRGGRNHGRSGGGNDSQSLGRQKKHATTQKEKYQNMARDAQGNGDRVQAEYYLQHVEHYERTLNDILAKEAERDEKRAEQQPAPKTHHIPPAKDVTSDDDKPEANAQADDTAAASDDADEKPEAKAKAPRKRAPRAPKAKAKDAEIPLPASVIPEAEGKPTAKATGSDA